MISFLVEVIARHVRHVCLIIRNGSCQLLHFSTVELITNNYDVVRSSISTAR
jgi:hypothetical protein